MLNKFRRAVRSRDYQLIAELVREYETVVKMTEREIHRLARSAEPDLEFEAWQDVVKTARERHPS